MLMVEINVEAVPVIEAEVDAVQQMRELDSYPGHQHRLTRFVMEFRISIVTSIEDRES